jgi:TolA-binding protein
MRKGVCLGIACAFLGGASRGPVALPDENPSPPLPETPSLKTPSLFHRPAMRSPAAQLAHAEELARAGNRRGAARQFLALVHQWHGSAEAPAAQFRFAEFLEQRGKYRRAFDEYQYLVDHYAGRFAFAEVLDRQFRLANCIRTERIGAVLFLPGFASPERAAPLFRRIVDNAPNGQRASEAAMHLAWILEDGRDFEEAVRVYEEIVQRDPDGRFCPEATFRRARCLYRIAADRGRDESSQRHALAALGACLSSDPENKEAPEARRMFDDMKARLSALYYERARFYDRTPGRQRAALMAYTDFVKEFPEGTHVEQARERIKVLQKQAGGGG